MKKRGTFGALAICVGLLGSACGGGKPAESSADAKADEASTSETKSGDEGSSDSKASTDEAKGDAAKDGKSSEPSEAKSDAPKPGRTPEDILTAPNVIYLFSFNDSEPRQAAEEKCTKKAGNDPKKMNQCMAAERKVFPAGGHRFKKDDRDQWWWITLRQTGNRLIAIHKVPVEFTEQTDTSVTLKPVGKDKGTQPGATPSKVVVEVPNDYQIAIKDPKAGRLVYQAKVDAVTE